MHNKQEELETLIDEADNIEHQLDMASALHKKEGKYADPVWYSKAKYALKCKRRQIHRLQREIARDDLKPLVVKMWNLAEQWSDLLDEKPEEYYKLKSKIQNLIL